MPIRFPQLPDESDASENRSKFPSPINREAPFGEILWVSLEKSA